jgi:hypothetical protein
MDGDVPESDATTHTSVTESRKRFGLLLIAIVAAFAVQGIAEPGRWEQLVVAVLLSATLLLALAVAETRRRWMHGAIALTIVIVAIGLANAVAGVTDGPSARAANLLLVVLAPPAIVIGIVRTLRARRRVTIEAVFGSLCLYMLVGMFFSLVYGVIGKIDGTFFAGGQPTTTTHQIYFSFTTLTTVGYGDYTAASNLGHTLAMTEALIGQIYLVTVVAVIVSNLGRTRLQGEAVSVQSAAEGPAMPPAEPPAGAGE